MTLRIVEMRKIDGKQYVGLQGQTKAEVLADNKAFVEERDKRAAEILRRRFSYEQESS